MRISLDHAHIFASDIDATIDFLAGMFGAAVVWDEEAAGTRSVRIQVGNAFIHIYDQPPKSEGGGPVHHLGIETDDLEGLVAQMKAKGFAFRNRIREEPRFRYVMVAGPDNLLIELFQSLEPERWKIDRD
jgi:catechol 2,3-dioxygenase-like lactoylglutathione lyase family enzyme